MERLKRLIREIHRRSLWQVLGIYLVASWMVFEIVQTVTEGLGLPEWFPPFAALLLLLGLPIVLATAFVQEGLSPTPRHDPTLMPTDEPEAIASRNEAVGVRRLLTWRNAMAGGVLAFALWGMIATGWLIFADRGPGEAVEAATELPAEERKMIAVLPFENLGPPEEEYFADGITDEITARLAGIHGLGVIARTSSIQYKDTDKTVPEIGAELGVDYILEGTVRWSRPADGPSRVRVTPQLIHVTDATHLWAEVYDEQIREVFSVQSRIAERVAEALDIALLKPERRALQARPTENLEAYDYYLRGNEHFARRIGEEDARIAAKMYERAVELDPEFAAAWAALTRTRVWLKFIGHSAELPRARDAVERARTLAPDLPETHMALGDVYYYGGREYDRALEEYFLVRERQPSNAEAIAFVGWIRRRQGRWDEAVANVARALELDPRNHLWLWAQANTYLRMRWYPEADRHFERAIRLAPDVPAYHRYRALLYLCRDDPTERAKQVLDEAGRLIDPAVLVAVEWLDIAPVRRILGPAYADALYRLSLENARVDTVAYFFQKAELSDRRNKPVRARADYDSARAVLEERIRAAPPGSPLRATLGLALAHLGRGEDAIREGRAAVEALPVSRDAYSGPELLARLAEIYAVVGERDAAIDQLEYLLSIPSPICVGVLKLDPIWDALRNHRRFQALLERYK